MAAINPEHLLEQADRLLAPPAAGAPRQADLRRAISAAYYSVFHTIATALADQFIGATKRSSTQYGLAYRSLNHRQLVKICDELKKPSPAARFRKHVPVGGFGADFVTFLTAVKDLQEKRHTADYDPVAKAHVADAEVAVSTARAAIARFNEASVERRIAFLALLAFEPREAA